MYGLPNIVRVVPVIPVRIKCSFHSFLYVFVCHYVI